MNDEMRKMSETPVKIPVLAKEVQQLYLQQGFEVVDAIVFESAIANLSAHIKQLQKELAAALSTQNDDDAVCVPVASNSESHSGWIIKYEVLTTISKETGIALEDVESIILCLSRLNMCKIRPALKHPTPPTKGEKV